MIRLSIRNLVTDTDRIKFAYLHLPVVGVSDLFVNSVPLEELSPRSLVHKAYN